MAATLDLNFLCVEQIDLKNFFFSITKNYNMLIEKIISIDNWMWENETVINDVNDIDETLHRNKIVVINFVCYLFKNLGMYIERVNEKYIYSIWINTEGYSELDSDIITLQNKSYYNKIYNEISRFKISYEILAIGIETTFDYYEDMVQIIQKSQNVVVWVINSDLDSDLEKYFIINRYKKRFIYELGVFGFEKQI